MACIGNAPAIGFVLFPGCTTPAHSRYKPKAISDAIFCRIPEDFPVGLVSQNETWDNAPTFTAWRRAE